MKRVLLSMQVGAAWYKIAEARHVPGVGTAFPLDRVNGNTDVHRQLEQAAAWLHEEPGAVLLDLDGVDGERYRVGPFF